MAMGIGIIVRMGVPAGMVMGVGHVFLPFFFAEVRFAELEGDEDGAW